MNNNDVMRIGDLKAAGNAWKLILMRLVSGLISYFVVFVSLLTFKIKYYDVISFMFLGLFNFFEIGVKSTCLNYIRDETGGVDLSDILYPFKANPIRFIGLALLSVAVFPLFFIFEILLYNIGVDISSSGLTLIEIVILFIFRYFLFIIPYLAIDYPEESILDLIKTGLFFERKLDFIYVILVKLPIPIIYMLVMMIIGFTPNGFFPESVFYFVWIVGGLLSFILLLINIPRIDMAYAVLYNNVIKTYYEEEDEVVNPYIKEYEDSYHEYGDFNSDDFID